MQKQSPETQSESDKPITQVEEAKEETLKDIISSIELEYFSDLNIEDIGDEDVSDIDESEIDLDKITLSEQNPSLSSQLKVQTDIID
jgi:hypothetical protein